MLSFSRLYTTRSMKGIALPASASSPPHDRRQGDAVHRPRRVQLREKENIPYWNSCLQGSTTPPASAPTISIRQCLDSVEGQARLTPQMRSRGIHLRTTIEPSVFYIGFDSLDPWGSATPTTQRARDGRARMTAAISDRVEDIKEYLSIFARRRHPSRRTMPSGIFGFAGRRGREPGHPRVARRRRAPPAARRGEAAARRSRLCRRARRTHRTAAGAVLGYRHAAPGPTKSRLDWWRKQFAKLDIQLVIRATDYNRFQDKMSKGNAQISFMGLERRLSGPGEFPVPARWRPMPRPHQGENAANYDNPRIRRAV